MYIIHDISWD